MTDDDLKPLRVGMLARYLPNGIVGRIAVKRDDMYLLRGPGWAAWAQRDEIHHESVFSRRKRSA